MSRLNPKTLFARIARAVPATLHGHLLVTGSLAAAYHFEVKLEGRAVNTKDADVVVHPAGDAPSTRELAGRLLDSGWRRTENCRPRPQPEPADELDAIRLYPPGGQEYFIELLNLPAGEQAEPKRWLPVRLTDGWYGLPSFRFMGLTAVDPVRSEVGLEYASPAMMALSNLLAHPRVGQDRMRSPGPTNGLLRSAKDLGRVLALAWLAEPEEAEGWLPVWREGLRVCFPTQVRALAAGAGAGLRELLADAAALEEATVSTQIGLLSGKGVTAAMLRATAQRLFQDVIDPLAEE